MTDPQPYDTGEEGYLAFVMTGVRRNADAQNQPDAKRVGEQGDDTDGR
ncbi:MULTISPECIES: hypothetical protein [Luteimonas]|nr:MULTISPECIES: hypothetical protein [Luteimonas]